MFQSGRPIGVNIEPVDQLAVMNEDQLAISKGGQVFKETFEEAENLNSNIEYSVKIGQ